MMSANKPQLPVPEPLRAEAPGTWAHSTVTVRLPEIARRVLVENSLWPEAVARLEQLIASLPAGKIRFLDEPDAPDREDWTTYIAPYLGQTWLAIPWFFAETYFYRRILESIGYYQDGPGKYMDPFVFQKENGLASALPAIRLLSAKVLASIAENRPGIEALRDLLYADLWGNRADLSLWPVERGGHEASLDLELAETAMLANDAIRAGEYLLNQGPPVRVDIVCDNAGYELAGDLLLGQYLLASGIIQELVLHVKSHPTFVSDAITADVHQTLSSLAADQDPGLSQLALDLRAAMAHGQLKLLSSPYWTSPLSGWEMPLPVRGDLSNSSLVVVKGDANYRRLLGNRHWPFTTPLEDILSYAPAPMLALRTLKAEVAAGLLQKHLDTLPLIDPEWMTNGKWGVIQLVIP